MTASGEAASHRQTTEVPDFPLGRQHRNNGGVRANAMTNANLLTSMQRTNSVGAGKNELANAAATMGNGLQPANSHQRNEFAGFQR